MCMDEAMMGRAREERGKRVGEGGELMMFTGGARGVCVCGRGEASKLLVK